MKISNRASRISYFTKLVRLDVNERWDKFNP